VTSSTYWSFWAGGLGLAVISVGHLLWTRRPLALSGGLARLLRFRADERERLAEAKIASGGLDEALLAATRARFGEAALADPPTDRFAAASGDENRDLAAGAAQGPLAPRLPIDCVALFVVCLALGAALSRRLVGVGAGVEPTSAIGFGLGEVFERIAGSGPGAALQLVVGGWLVGFGARMAGGCTSGHGLSGLASFQLASALATAAMFAGGIAVSFWLEGR
jgi:hypothetical protein